MLPRVAEALHLAANPGRMLSCLINTSGEPGWKEVVLFAAGEGGDTFVALEKHEGGYGLVLLNRKSASGAREHVRGLLEFQEVPAVSPPAAVSIQTEASAGQCCPACHEPVAPGARFRSRCGTDLSAGQSLLCPRCGAEVKNPRSRFCTHCGAELQVRAPDSGATGEVRAPLAQPSLPPSPTRLVAERRCPNPRCGRPVPQEKKFCMACGTRVPQEE